MKYSDKIMYDNVKDFFGGRESESRFQEQFFWEGVSLNHVFRSKNDRTDSLAKKTKTRDLISTQSRSFDQNFDLDRWIAKKKII